MTQSLVFFYLNFFIENRFLLTGIELDDMTVHLSDTSPTQSSGEEVPRKYYQQTPRKEG